MIKQKKTLLVVSGPTAVGKTDLCINLAKKFNTSIISADSRQLFKEMNIGTAKPSPPELEAVPHYMVGTYSIHDPYDVRMYENDVLALLGHLFLSSDIVILTGGSGLYINAVSEGLDDMPEVDKEIRSQLNSRFKHEGLGSLQQQLKQLDPVYFDQVDLHNPQRIIRALEVCIGTGRAYSSFRIKKTKERAFQVIKIGLDRGRKELYERIDSRMDKMIQQGLFEEAAQLHPYQHLNALQTVGYKEIFGFFEDLYDKDEAIRLLKRNSRRYAKRQLTWMKKDEGYTWFHPDQWDDIVDFIQRQISE